MSFLKLGATVDESLMLQCEKVAYTFSGKSCKDWSSHFSPENLANHTRYHHMVHVLSSWWQKNTNEGWKEIHLGEIRCIFCWKNVHRKVISTPYVGDNITNDKVTSSRISETKIKSSKAELHKLSARLPKDWLPYE